MSGLFERILNDQSIVTGMLLIIAVGSLTFAYRHLRPFAGRRQCVHSKTRRAPATGRIQSPAHSRGPAADGGRWTGGDPWMSPPPRAAAGHPRPIGDPRPTGYPSWPGRPDPRWAAAEAALRAEDYPSWPERRESPWPTAAPPPARPYPGRAVPHAGPVREGRATEVQVRPEATSVRRRPTGPYPASRRRARSGTRARSSWPPGFSPRPMRRRPRYGTRPATTRPRHWRMRRRRPLSCCGMLRTRPRRNSPRPSSRPPRPRRPS